MATSYNHDRMKLNGQEWRQKLERVRSFPIIEYANIIGLEPQKIGKRFYTLKHHDSVRIEPEKNLFLRNSTGAHGDIIDFSMEFEGKAWKDAFRDLLKVVGEDVVNSSTNSSFQPIASKNHSVSAYLDLLHTNETEAATLVKERNLELPAPDVTSKNRNVYAYLIKTRGIDKGIVDSMIRNHNLYQDVHHNCVFVSYDESGKPDFACLRGTNTHKRFVADVRGCNYDNCFYLDNQADTMIVTESVIDSMSVMTVMQQHGRDLSRYNYLALAGTQKSGAVRSRLERRMEIQNVVLALDNDQGGLSAITDIWEDLDKMGFQGKRIEFLPEKEKDWNAELVAMQNKSQTEQSETPGWEQTDEVEL